MIGNDDHNTREYKPTEGSKYLPCGHYQAAGAKNGKTAGETAIIGGLEAIKVDPA